MELSECVIHISNREIPILFQNNFSFSWLFLPIFHDIPRQDFFPCFSMTVDSCRTFNSRTSKCFGRSIWKYQQFFIIWPIREITHQCWQDGLYKLNPQNQYRLTMWIICHLELSDYIVTSTRAQPTLTLAYRVLSLRAIASNLGFSVLTPHRLPNSLAMSPTP